MFRYISNNKAIIFLGAVVLAGILWMTPHASHGPASGPLERAVAAVAFPFVKAGNAAAGAVVRVWRGYVLLAGQGTENERLHKENGRLFLENTRLKEALLSASRVEDLVAMKDGLPYPTITARVIGRDASAWFRSVWIDEGESKGVRRHMPAATYTGIVGRVIRTGGGSSRVLLITDGGSSVSCLSERTRDPGILTGDGSGTLRLQYVGKHADVRAGDLIVTSGLDGVFPPGMPAGVVVRADKAQKGYFMDVEVSPTADLDGVEELMVIDYTPPARPEEPAETEAAKKKGALP